MPNLDTALITTASVENIDDAIVALTDRLQAHSLQQYDEVHGTFVNTLQPSFGSSGTRFARRFVRVKVGGSFYHLPADVSPTGPPRIPIITQDAEDAGSTADQDKELPHADFTAMASGLPPLSFSWELYNPILAEWIPAVIGNTTDGYLGLQILVIDVVSGANASTLTIQPIAHKFSGFYRPAEFVRCKVDNLSVDGGVTYSNPPTAARPTGGAMLTARNRHHD